MKLTCGHCGEELKLIHGAIHECETTEDRESAIYATGYWNGIQKAKEKNETLDTRSYLIGRYDGLRELTDEEIIKNFLDKQTQLPPEFLKILYDNLWNLYESE